MYMWTWPESLSANGCQQHKSDASYGSGGVHACGQRCIGGIFHELIFHEFIFHNFALVGEKNGQEELEIFGNHV